MPGQFQNQLFPIAVGSRVIRKQDDRALVQYDFRCGIDPSRAPAVRGIRNSARFALGNYEKGKRARALRALALEMALPSGVRGPVGPEFKAGLETGLPAGLPTPHSTGAASRRRAAVYVSCFDCVAGGKSIWPRRESRRRRREVRSNLLGVADQRARG